MARNTSSRCSQMCASSPIFPAWQQARPGSGSCLNRASWRRARSLRRTRDWYRVEGFAAAARTRREHVRGLSVVLGRSGLRIRLHCALVCIDGDRHQELRHPTTTEQWRAATNEIANEYVLHWPHFFFI